MFTLTKDELIVLNAKVNSPTFALLLGDDEAEDPAAAAAGLEEKGVLEGSAVNPKITELLDILDNAPEQKIVKMSQPPIPKATGLDAEGGGGDDGGGGGGGGFMGFMGGGGGGMGPMPGFDMSAVTTEKVPTDLLAQKGDVIGVVGHITVKEWANKWITYTLEILPKDQINAALVKYLGFIETADSQMLRKFISNVSKKNHDLYISTFTNRGPMLAMRRYRRGYSLSSNEMMQFNAFLFNMKENFDFKYTVNGKEIPCECMRSGLFQIISFPSKSLFGGETKKFCHLGMAKSFSEIQRSAA